MKTERFKVWATLVLAVSTMLGASALALFSGTEAEGAGGEGHAHAQSPEGLKYPRGETIKQELKKPDEGPLAMEAWGGASQETVRAFLGGHAAVKTAKIELRHRYVTRITGVELEAGAGAKEKLANYQYDLLYDGVPIAKASRTLITKDGKPLLIRDRNFPSELKLKSTKPTLSFEAASSMARKHSKEMFAKIYPKKKYPNAEPLLAVQTQDAVAPHLEIWLDNEQKNAQVAWTFNVASTDLAHPFLRKYWIVGTAEADIHFEDRIFYCHGDGRQFPPSGVGPLVGRQRNDLEIPNVVQAANPPVEAKVAKPLKQPLLIGTHGTVTGTVWTKSPFDPPQTLPLAGLNVTVIKNGIPHQAVTNKDGKYSLLLIGGAVIVKATLAGPFCQIVNDATPNTVMAVTKAGTGQVDLNFKATTEFEFSQVTAFHSVNRVHDFVKDFLPTPLTKLNNVATHVNINQTCNAFWQPGAHSLNFFRAQGPMGCPNTAYPDVAFHEYGHGIDDELGGILDGGYSEGFGDSVAVLITRSPIIGLNFFGPGKNLRNASEVHTWPMVMGSGDPHEVGEAYNGFTWELTQQLKTKYANADKAFEVARKLILGAAAHNPTTIPDAVQWSFFVDAHIFPGPPGGQSLHFKQLTAAKNSRKIP